LTEDHKALVERIKRSAMCVYIATEVGPATDMAECFRQAAAAIESLSEQVERAEAERDAAVAEAIERCAKMCDAKADEARKVWDDYTERCRLDPKNIGAGSTSWYQYYESCANAIRSLSPAAGDKRRDEKLRDSGIEPRPLIGQLREEKP
jgi:hypothetical protein